MKIHKLLIFHVYQCVSIAKAWSEVRTMYEKRSFTFWGLFRIILQWIQLIFMKKCITCHHFASLIFIDSSVFRIDWGYRVTYILYRYKHLSRNLRRRAKKIKTLFTDTHESSLDMHWHDGCVENFKIIKTLFLRLLSYFHFFILEDLIWDYFN